MTALASNLSLQTQNLSIGYDRKRVIDCLNFELPQNASLSIIGESGCGKSTLLASLAGQKTDYEGNIIWKRNGVPVALKRLRTSFVWQNLGLFPWMRVIDNLKLPLKLKSDFLGMEKNSDSKLMVMLEELKLLGLEKRFPSELSGGQRQRLAIGRALIVQPELMFLDEPFSALDALLREHLQDFLIEVRRKYPCQLVLVTHDISEAVRLTSHVLVLAAHPFRKVAFFENLAFNHKIGCSDRDSNLFYDTVREIHSLLRSASGRLYQ